jgi:hypothetical protein
LPPGRGCGFQNFQGPEYLPMVLRELVGGFHFASPSFIPR